MKTLLLAFLISSPALASYPQEAKLQIEKEITSVSRSLKALGPNSEPHETKTLRKEIGTLRDKLDLFVYALPKDELDFWYYWREFLDEGYESMGAFKDLYDTQGLSAEETPEYDSEEVSELLTPLIEWKSTFLKNAPKWKTYLGSIDGRFYERNKSMLSRFFWGAVEDLPVFSQSAEENFSGLAAALAREAQKDYLTVQELEDLSEFERSEQFHDFRKRTRSIAKILRLYPNLARKLSTEDASLLEALQEKYGQVNDKIVTGHRHEQKGKEKKAKKAQEQANELWYELKNWQNEIGAPKLLKRIEKALK